VLGEYQNIVFGEFFSLLVGKNSLLPRFNARTFYDPSVDPSIANEVSSASFRLILYLISKV